MPQIINERIDVWNVNSALDLIVPGEENFSDFEKELLSEGLRDAETNNLYWMTTNTVFFRYKPECEPQLLKEEKQIIKVVK